MELSSAHTAPTDPYVLELLRYLEHGFPKYPFDRKLDSAFIAELVADFDRLDLLEQIKTFRWYYNDDLSRIGNPRSALRKWMARAWDRSRP
jgi:hypothetical protein